MNKAEFQKLFREQIIVLDGATGSNLQKKGMPSGCCVEQWVCENEEALIELQKSYVEAGSDVIYASTFAANRIKLKEFGMEKEVAELNRRLLEISKKAAGEHTFVAGDVTMTGQQLEPLGTLKLEELIDVYKEQMAALEAGGADFLVVETMMSLQETRAALIAAREATALPVLVTMSFGEDGRTLYGTDARTAAVVLEGLGAAAVGVNCSAGPDKIVSVIRDMKSVSALPIVAKPNAGLPKLASDGSTSYDMPVDVFARHMEAVIEAGATVLGGCCGTSPDYIREVKRLAENAKPEFKENICSFIASERTTLEWSDSVQIGTISGTEDTELAEEWADEIYDTLYDTIDEYTDEEVQCLCICMDGTEEEAPELMANVIKETVSYTSLPLVFQSDSEKVLERALREYPGRSAIITKEGQKEALKPLAESYGAVLV